MKMYLLFPILITVMVLTGLSSGLKMGENSFTVAHEKSVASTSAPKISPEILRKDLEEIKKILITNHPAPYQFTGKEAFDKFYNEQLKKIDRPMSLGEYFIIAAPIVESLHCGHTWIILPDEFWNYEAVTYFPLGLLFSGDKAYAAPSSDINAILQGSQIISVNKIPMADIIESTKRLVNSDGKSKTAKLANFGHSFPDLFAIQYGNPDGYEVNFIPPGSTEIHKQLVKSVSRKTAWENPVSTLAGSISTGNELQIEIEKTKNLAVLSIRTFGYYNNQQKFYAFLDSAFEQVHHSAVQSLILDLRNNSGGDPVCASRLLSYLERVPTPYFAHAYAGYEALAKPIPMSGKNVFTGKLLVLINGGCFSTTGHICSLLKYNKLAQFVGEETGGTYECNDNHIRLNTSATHLMLNVARTTYTTAVKGISRETGIMPDYPVEPTIGDFLAGRDAVKQYTMKLVEAGSVIKLK
jgi:hypothetical protein